MKTNIQVLLFLIFGQILSVHGQNNTGNYSSRRVARVEVRNLDVAEKKLNDFFIEHKINILSQTITISNIKTEFVVEDELLGKIDALLNNLGYLVSKNYTYNDSEQAILSLQNELHHLIHERTANEQQRDKIADNQARISVLQQNKNKTHFSLSVSEEDMVGEDVVFVNMPGFEYGFLFTENPKAGLSAPMYQTYTIKFLITRGKCYFLLSMMNAVGKHDGDPALYTEYFLLNFGQDFYTRHLGRGRRRYFNPYISYQIGGFLATNKDANNKFIFNANVSTGVELIKTRMFLLDSKVSYFMPIHESFQNMRGLQVGISANVLF
jgi:hypothetical protein